MLGYIRAKPINLFAMAFLEEYTLLDELGQGGYATVYKVRHNELGYIRALRVMNAVIARGTEDKIYQRFIDECRLLMRIGNGNHPNIIHVCRTLLKDQRAAVEMDYVDGSNLTKYVAECGGFVPIEDVMKLVEQIGSALAYCHHDIYRFCMDRVEDDLQDDPDDGSKVLLDDEIRSRLIQKYRVIHNDIHSDNIKRRDDGNYMLLDFGLAIQGDNVVRSSRRSDGAPEFKAPEKWDGDIDLTTQSDIYSFGIVIYECLTGRVPFPLAPEEVGSAKAMYDLSEAHKSRIPDSIYELRKVAYEKVHPGKEYTAPDYPQWLEDVVMKCLEKNPHERFANGKELYDYVMAKKSEPEPQQNESEIVPQPEELPQPSMPVTVSENQKIWKVMAIIAVSIALLASIGVIWGVVKIKHQNGEYVKVSSQLQTAKDSLEMKERSLENVAAALEEALKPVVPLAEDHPAVKYLNEHSVKLSRSEMLKFPELNGLWEALNTYDYQAYASYFDLLQNSDNYFWTLKQLRSRKEAMKRMNEIGRTHVAEDEDIIQIMSYIFKLY